MLIILADNEAFLRLNEHRRTLVKSGKSDAIVLGQELIRETSSNLDPTMLERAIELALCQAAARFDPLSGIKFPTFAFNFIKGSLLAAVAFNLEPG